MDIWKFKNYEFLFSSNKLLHIKGQECWQWKKEKNNTITKFIKFITWSPKAPISLRPSKVSSATFSISSFFAGSLLSWIIIEKYDSGASGLFRLYFWKTNMCTGWYILSLVPRGEILTHNDYQAWENWLFENKKISNSPLPYTPETWRSIDRCIQ